MNSMLKRLTVCGLTLCIIGLGEALAQSGTGATPPAGRERPAGREGRQAPPGREGRQAPPGREGASRGGAKVGEKAPEWTLTDQNGKTHKSSDYAGKIVVMDWVNPQCPYCKGVHNDGRVKKMMEELRAMGDVVFIGVNSSNFTNAKENIDALKAYGVEYPVMIDADGKVGHMFGARTTPHVFVIDQTGVLRYQGAVDNSEKGDKTGADYTNYAVNAVKQIKAGETVSPTMQRPYGCSVKYAQPKREGREKDGEKEMGGDHDSDGHGH